MKLLRVGNAGEERPAMVDADGMLRDLSGLVSDIAGTALLPASIERLRRIDPKTLPLSGRHAAYWGVCWPRGEVHLYWFELFRPRGGVGHGGSCGAGGFYEGDIFHCGPYDDVIIPRGSEKTDWEVELGVVIGKEARYVTEDDALSHVAGYCVVNDVSERAFSWREPANG